MFCSRSQARGLRLSLTIGSCIGKPMIKFRSRTAQHRDRLCGPRLLPFDLPDDYFHLGESLWLLYLNPFTLRKG